MISSSMTQNSGTPLTQPGDWLDFMRTHTATLPVPLVPELVLHVANDETDLWHKSEEDLAALGLESPFWAFAWAGGQALARLMLDEPARVQGKTVLDLASGSGLAGLAAAKAGARIVTANDLDPIAMHAIALNAHANDLALIRHCGNLLTEMPAEDVAAKVWDVILVGDMFYEEQLAREVLAWLLAHHEQGSTIYVGDPERAYFPREQFSLIAQYETPRTRQLEDMEIRKTSAWCL